MGENWEPVCCGRPAEYMIEVNEIEDWDSYAEQVCGFHLEHTIRNLTADTPEQKFPVCRIDPVDEKTCKFSIGPEPPWDVLPDAARS